MQVFTVNLVADLSQTEHWWQPNRYQWIITNIKNHDYVQVLKSWIFVVVCIIYSATAAEKMVIHHQNIWQHTTVMIRRHWHRHWQTQAHLVLKCNISFKSVYERCTVDVGVGFTDKHESLPRASAREFLSSLTATHDRSHEKASNVTVKNFCFKSMLCRVHKWRLFQVTAVLSSQVTSTGRLGWRDQAGWQLKRQTNTQPTKVCSQILWSEII